MLILFNYNNNNNNNINHNHNNKDEYICLFKLYIFNVLYMHEKNFHYYFFNF